MSQKKTNEIGIVPRRGIINKFNYKLGVVKDKPQIDNLTPEERIKESLRDWFKKENWVRINTSGNISGDCGTMKKGKATTRCLPKKKAQSLTKAERKATVAKKVRGDKKGKQFVKNTKKAEFKKK